MDIGEVLRIASFAVTIVSTIGTVVVGIWAWGAKQAVKGAALATAAGKVGPLEKRVDDLEKEAERTRDRLRGLETKVAEAPTLAMFGTINVSIAKIEGDINTVKAKIEGLDALVQRVENAVNMHQEHLLKRMRTPG